MNILGLVSAVKLDGAMGCTTFLNHYSYLVHKRCGTRLDAFDAIHVDGIAMVWLLRAFGVRASRLSFDYSSIADAVFQWLEMNRKTLFIAGAQQGEIVSFVTCLRDRYPAISIVGFESGHFESDTNRANCIAKIVDLKPDVLLVGMGAPLQEDFIIDVLDKGWSGVAYTCGGFIHQTAAKGGKYYPPIFDRLHLRWLYRLIDEPKLWKRYFISYPVASAHLIKDAIVLRVFSARRYR
ncbi:WecB/TagA/CpsF family glycosyltransferase [Stenotrophomonas sp. YIM B06876]|uniref:WecB/TagA/CpsF family glycosyltransferase n=1 Tax=Stenotrophomonas sp. YIM B06876 TaxID=3060211 RepID=UPI002738DAD0|nr:WecB/TagA/CpsF family glycosyltransferase [Stenotrophomonas sp. YIM B06876]